MVDILLVDDDTAVRDVMREVLQDEGYRVSEVGNGYAAFALLSAAATPLVVVLDMRLPGMDGLTLLRQLRDAESEATHRHAILLCTAGRIDFTEDVQAVLASMQVSLLAKPFDLDTLIAQVASAAQRLDAL